MPNSGRLGRDPTPICGVRSSSGQRGRNTGQAPRTRAREGAGRRMTARPFVLQSDDVAQVFFFLFFFDVFSELLSTSVPEVPSGSSPESP